MLTISNEYSLGSESLYRKDSLVVIVFNGICLLKWIFIFPNLRAFTLGKGFTQHWTFTASMFSGLQRPNTLSFCISNISLLIHSYSGHPWTHHIYKTWFLSSHLIAGRPRQFFWASMNYLSWEAHLSSLPGNKNSNNHIDHFEINSTRWYWQ